MDRNLAMEFVRVTEAGALASARWVGRGDKMSADNAAVRAMRALFDTVDIDGRIVIGEGEKDKAPMLYIGERVGQKRRGSLKVDVAVDPLEGTNIVASGGTGAISVLAVAPENCLLHAPDIYMDKIAVGSKAKDVISLDASVEENLHNIAGALGKNVEELTIVILDRPRHEEKIRAIREVGSRIFLIKDGDVSPAVAAAFEDSGVDVMMGIGGAPEGVLAAAALYCLGGEIQGRLKPKDENQKERIKEMGLEETDKLLNMEDLVTGEDVFFAATGITDSSLLKGVRFNPDGAVTSSVIMRYKSGTVRHIEAWHHFEKKPFIEQIKGP